MTSVPNSRPLSHQLITNKKKTFLVKPIYKNQIKNKRFNLEIG